MSINEDEILDLLEIKGKTLFHREGQTLEFKEQFNFAGLSSYLKDFAAFANNKGGYLIFGVKNSPRIPVGLNESSYRMFEKIDPEKISSFILNIFSANIHWDQATITTHGKKFGIFKIIEATKKPIIAKSNAGKGNEIKNCDIYYRYGGRTQNIQFAELENIIAERINRNNRQWQDLIQKIGEAGPQNAAILDTENAIISKEDSQILVIDEDLLKKLRFIKDENDRPGEVESALKLVGDVVPVSHVEVIKRIKENRLERYPLSAMQLAHEIKLRLPYVNQQKIWQAIKDNDLKNNPDYSIYNFRNKQQEEEYERTGELPNYIISIYNKKALQFLLNLFRQNR